MNELKRTPAPWLVHKNRFNNGNEDIIVSTLKRSHDSVIAIIDSVSKDEETVIGNANLIAAAPDLLKALKNILESNFIDISEESDKYSSFTNAAIRAIKKATV